MPLPLEFLEKVGLRKPRREFFRKHNPEVVGLRRLLLQSGLDIVERKDPRKFTSSVTVLPKPETEYCATVWRIRLDPYKDLDNELQQTFVNWYNSVNSKTTALEITDIGEWAITTVVNRLRKLINRLPTNDSVLINVNVEENYINITRTAIK